MSFPVTEVGLKRCLGSRNVESGMGVVETGPEWSVEN